MAVSVAGTNHENKALTIMHTWNFFDSFAEAADAAAEYIKTLIITSIEVRGECHIALPGGNSPAACLDKLSTYDLPWQNISWYVGDERVYPVDHEDRNDVMLDKVFWSKLPAKRVFPIPVEMGTEQSARLYSKVISEISHLDIIFLGMGEDGHTASLFPGNKALELTEAVVPVYNSPKPPPERVSLSVGTITNARNRVLLTGGSAKQNIIKQVMSGDALPVNMIGDIVWFVDNDAKP